MEESAEVRGSTEGTKGDPTLASAKKGFSTFEAPEEDSPLSGAVPASLATLAAANGATF